MQTRRRITVLLVVVFLALAALAARVTELQALQHTRLETMAERQQLVTIPLEPHRGLVLDRRGRPLAINVEATSLYAVPSAILDRRAFAVTVAPVLGLNVEEVERRLTAGRHFAWLARKVDAQTAGKMKALNLGGQIGFLREDRRAYPNADLAAHVLGFVGIDNQGLSGVELSYDAVLRGQGGQAVAERDGVGRVLVETQRLIRAPDDGDEVLLTIDQVVQHIAERELEAALTRTGAKRGSVTVMDPTTGEVLALAVRPAFDPNQAGKARPERWLPLPLAQVYEPGSTFKIFLVAAALDSGAMNTTERVFCPGFLRVPGNYIIRDAHNLKHGWQTMGDIVKNSCNVGAAQIATKLGKETFYRYITRFGFGAPTGVDLPGEAAGIVPPPGSWLGPGLQTISFGQGISATALQVLTAATALANNGVIVRPHVVRAVRDSQGRLVKVVGPESIRHPVDPATARKVLQMMVDTVAEGTGIRAAIDGYPVAGKTGTAQKPAPTGGYDPDRYVASFLGIVPANDPKLVILVVLDEPQGVYFGGAVAAPVFREVASRTLWYLRIPPTGDRVRSGTPSTDQSARSAPPSQQPAQPSAPAAPGRRP